MKKLSIALTFMMSVTLSSHAQWAQNTTLEGGILFDILKTSGGIFAAGPGGVFRSTDNGATWAFSGNGLANTNSTLQATNLAATNTALFVLGGNQTAKRSTDNGSSWSSLTVSEASNTDIATFQNNLFVSTVTFADLGVFVEVYQSTDNGNTFTRKDSFTSATGFNANLYMTPSALYVISGNTIKKTTDGNTFSPVANTGLPADAFLWSLIEAGGSPLVISSSQMADEVYKFDGLIWKTSGTNLPTEGYLESLLDANNNLFITHYDPVTGNSTVHKSTDNGTTWTKVNVSGLQVSAIYGLIMADANKLMSVSPGGLFTSSDGGITWTGSNNDLFATSHGDIVNANGNLLIDGETGILRSTDQGQQFSPSVTGLPAGTNVFNITQAPAGNTLPAATYTELFQTDFEQWRSADGGQSWSKLSSPNGVTNTTLLGSAGPAAYIRGFDTLGGSFHYFQMMNGSTKWNEITLPADLIFAFDFMGNEKVVYASGFGQQTDFYRSEDNGATWAADTDGLSTDPNAQISLFYDQNGHFFIVQTVFSQTATSVKLYRRGTDAWQEIETTGLPLDQSFVINIYGYSDAAYVLLNNGRARIFVSTDMPGATGSATFTEFNEGFIEGVSINALAFSGENAFAVTNGNGLWKRKAAGTLGVSNIGGKEGWSLYSYPNPAGYSTQMEFTIIEAGAVAIDLFDVNGTLIRQLVNEHKQAGTYQLPVDVQELPAGVYSYKLSTAEKAMVKKLVVVR